MKCFFNLFLSNPCKDWPRYEQLSPLKVNLRDLSLNNVKLGDSWNELITIGKPDNNNALRIDTFEYKELGCSITITDGIISSFYIYFSSSQCDLYSTQIDLICEDGVTLHIDSNSKITELQSHIGHKKRKETDEDGITFAYESNTTILEIDCLLDYTIIGITLEQKPIVLPEIQHNAFDKQIRLLTIFAYFLSLCSVIWFLILLFFYYKSFTMLVAAIVFPFLFIYFIQLSQTFTICPKCRRFIFGRYEPKHKENIKFKCENCQIILITNVKYYESGLL